MKFNSYAKIFSAMTLVVALSACGGGSTDGGAGAVVTPPVSGGTTAAPDGSDINSVIAFAKESGGYYTLQNDVKRYQTSKTIDGTKYTAWVDSLPGIGDAVVGYQVDDGQMVYTLNGDAGTAATPVSGVYNGQNDISYRLSSSGDWQMITSTGYIQLDMTTGTGSFAGGGGNTNNNMDIAGTVTVSGSTVSADNMNVDLRDGQGNFIKRYTGSIQDGQVIAGTDGPTNQAIIGKLSSSDPDGFEMNGAFDFQYSKDYN